PFAYLNKKALDLATYDERYAIHGFVKTASSLFDVYLISPIDYYDVGEHVKADNDLTMFPPAVAAQAFLAVSMTIPMFRAINASMSSLRDSNQKIDNRLTQAEGEIKNLSKRVDQLAHQVEVERREALRRAAEAEAELQAKIEAERRLIALDPFLFAVPRGTDVSTY